MPLIPFTHQKISVPVADKTTALGVALFKQEATFDELHLVGGNRGPVALVLTTQVEYRTMNNEEIPAGLGFRPAPVNLTANNSWAVYYNPDDLADPRNGQPLYFNGGVEPLAWGTVTNEGLFVPLEGGLEATPEPLLRQGDWVETMLLAMLKPLIESNMVAANLAPFNRYA